MSSIRDVISAYVERRSGRLPTADIETGGYTLAIGGRFIVQIWQAGSGVVGRLWLGDLPIEGSERAHVLHRMMARQLAELGQEEIVVSADANSREIYLHRQIPSAGFGEAELADLLQSLVDAAGRYRQQTSPPVVAASPLPPLIIRP